LTSTDISTQEKYETTLVDELKDIKPNEYDEFIEDYTSKHDSKIVVKLEDKGIQENDNLNVLINNKEFKNEYKIDDNSIIEFNSNGIILDSLEESPEKEATEPINDEENTAFTKIKDKVVNTLFGESVAAASSTKTKSASNSRIAYSVYGTKLFEAKIGADFTYDGTKVTAQRTINYIKKYFDGGLWSVYDKESAVQKPSDKKRVAYQSGTASWGLSVYGVGIVIQERYIRVNVACDEKGNITKSSILE